MYAGILCSAAFYLFLLQIDRDLAAEVRRSKCLFCGAALHSACYARRPRGVPAGVDAEPEFGVCFSFCCSAEGCRRRHRAPSVRFLGRKVYLAAMVSLLTAMRQGPTPRTARQLRSLFGADRRTLVRWRRWWQVLFPQGDFWRRRRDRFLPPVAEADLPRSLIDRFAGPGLQERVIAMLRFLGGLFIACNAL